MYYVLEIKFMYFIYVFIWTKYEKKNVDSKEMSCWNVLKCKIYKQFFSIQVFFLIVSV
jgi:hypothetical protein